MLISAKCKSWCISEPCYLLGHWPDSQTAVSSYQPSTSLSTTNSSPWPGGTPSPPPSLPTPYSPSPPTQAGPSGTATSWNKRSTTRDWGRGSRKRVNRIKSKCLLWSLIWASEQPLNNFKLILLTTSSSLYCVTLTWGGQPTNTFIMARRLTSMGSTTSTGGVTCTAGSETTSAATPATTPIQAACGTSLMYV